MKAIKNLILALCIFSNALNGMEQKKGEFALERNDDDVALYPELNRRIDRKGNVIGTANGHIYWQPDSSVDKNSISLSPNGERLSYCSSDANGKNRMFCFYNLQSEKAEAPIKPKDKPELDSHSSAFFVSNDLVYLHSEHGYPLHPGSAVADDLPVYTFYDLSTQGFTKIKNRKLLRGFAAINSKSVLFAASENKSPYRIYAIDPQNKTIKETGITTRITPHVESTQDGSVVAIGDLECVKAYREKNGMYDRVGTWKFLRNHITAFAFDKNNRLIIATENGDICFSDTELKASLILLNINTIANHAIKGIEQFSGIVTKMMPLNNTIIATIMDTKTKKRDLYLINGDFNKKLEELIKVCKKELDKRKNACVTL
ncbi:MAG TPA: hypothetical protein VHO47_02845 [Candidatus Babeliales bacterium]|nr:hypothetical protein [Candidatus Babeliales bacterium]